MKQSTNKKKGNPTPTVELTAKKFIQELQILQSNAELEKIQRYFKSGEGAYAEGDRFIGVKMGNVFALAKKFAPMELLEIEKLLENPIHEVRAGAVSIMDFQARDKKTDEEGRRKLYSLYINRHDRINNWDLVDRCAPYVVGGYLFDKSRKPLHKLARSKNIWERRTSIVSTFYFIRKGDTDETFRIAEMLLKDEHDLIHKAAGGWIRAAGVKDKEKLIGFLNRHAAVMPRTMLRCAIEHLGKKEKIHYLGLKKKG